MTPEAFQQLERLYHLALAQPPEWRAAYIAQACGGDEALRKELESLLVSSEDDGEYLETPALAVAAQAKARHEASTGTADARPPTRLGRYRITGVLGAGGMGTVYRGVDPVIDRSVAIKTIRREFLGSPAEASRLSERLKREARAAGGLTHPNIVTVFDAGEEQGFTFIVMEFIPGSPLDSILASEGTPLSAHRALEILRQAAAALDFAHGHGVIHRDVKPSNIMVQQDGNLKLTDFGIARVTHASATLTGGVAGSPCYISPEQLRGCEAEPRSDQYSLAVVAWTLLTGSVPFDDKQMMPLIEKIMGQEPPLSIHLSPAADGVLRRALAKDPAARFESCGFFVAELRQAFTFSARPPVAEASSPATLSKRGRIAIGGLLAACLFAWGAVAWKWKMASTVVGETPKAVMPAQVQSQPPAMPQAAAVKPRTKLDPVKPAAPPAPSRAAELVTPPSNVPDKKRSTAAPISAKLGAARINGVDGLKYVWIPPGSFAMGCSPGDGECLDDERPVHAVTISTGFWIGQTEVTEEAYRKVTGQGPANPQRSKRPINGVEWGDALAYCQAVGMRLATEAEWEYAARAGSAASRYGELDRVAWYAGNSGHESHDVAGKDPNAWGLYDMLGNVWEWTADWYGRYSPQDATDPVGPSQGRFRVRRGGGSKVAANAARASYRVKYAGNPHYSAGFRCAGN